MKERSEGKEAKSFSIYTQSDRLRVNITINQCWHRVFRNSPVVLCATSEPYNGLCYLQWLIAYGDVGSRTKKINSQRKASSHNVSTCSRSRLPICHAATASTCGISHDQPPCNDYRKQRLNQSSTIVLMLRLTHINACIFGDNEKKVKEELSSE